MIWDRQSVPECFDSDIAAIAKLVFDIIYDENRPTANIETYCKREECWQLVSKAHYELQEGIVEVLISSQEYSVEQAHAKKEQQIDTGIRDELGIFQKGADYWLSMIERGTRQDVIGYSEIKALKNAVNYCNLVYPELSAKQIKDIIATVQKLRENGIE